MAVAGGVGYKIEDWSGDVVVSADAPTEAQALVEIARGVAHVQTAGSAIGACEEVALDVIGPDRHLTLVRFVNELVFLFETEGFLASSGDLKIEESAQAVRVHGTLRGDAFSPARHGWGTEVKSATLHEVVSGPQGGRWRARVLLDL